MSASAKVWRTLCTDRRTSVSSASSSEVVFATSACATGPRGFSYIRSSGTRRADQVANEQNECRAKVVWRTSALRPSSLFENIPSPSPIHKQRRCHGRTLARVSAVVLSHTERAPHLSGRAPLPMSLSGILARRVLVSLRVTHVDFQGSFRRFPGRHSRDEVIYIDVCSLCYNGRASGESELSCWQSRCVGMVR